MAFDVTKCDFCGECLERCNYTEYTEEQGAQEIKALTESKEARILDECVTCWACNTFCPTGANPADLILLKMEEKGYDCTQALIRVVETHDTPQMSPSSVKKGEPGKPIFSACTFHDIIPHLYEGQLFEGATFLLGGDYETMLVWEHIARPTTFKNGLAKKIENIAKAAGENEVIFMHDDCYATVTTKAKEYGIPVPFKPIQQAEYFRDYLKEHQAQVRKLNLKIAYHLPCATHYISGLNGWIDEVMELIGCERVERTYDRDNQLCCGGIVAARHGAEACRKVREANINDARDAGAEAFIMHCYPCAIGLRDMASEAGMKPYMLPELVRLALGETLSGAGAGLGDAREIIQLFAGVTSGQIQEVPF